MSTSHPTGIDEAWLAPFADVEAMAEDLAQSLLSGIPILGEPSVQRAVDDWVDAAVAALTGLAHESAEILGRVRIAQGCVGPPTSGGRVRGSSTEKSAVGAAESAAVGAAEVAPEGGAAEAAPVGAAEVSAAGGAAEAAAARASERVPAGAASNPRGLAR